MWGPVDAADMASAELKTACMPHLSACMQHRLDVVREHSIRNAILAAVQNPKSSAFDCVIVCDVALVMSGN